MNSQELLDCIIKLQKLFDYLQNNNVYYNDGMASISFKTFSFSVMSMNTIYLYNCDKLLITIDAPDKLTKFIEKLYTKTNIVI